MSRAIQIQALPIERLVGSHLKVQASLCFLLFAAVVLKVWIESRATKVGYELASARKYAVELDMQRRELELHKSFLLRPDTLKRSAATRLGLQELNPKQATKIQYVH
jgi:cell division protein FtsL